MDKIKNFKDAVKAAKERKKEGFSWLYEKTCREKYYIAVKYMKNDADAEDVLQESYLKAWDRIDSLKDPDKFSSWFGQIVARTALDALKKKKRIFFHGMEEEEGSGEEFLYAIEDKTAAHHPELAYMEKERGEILRSMVDTLSEEQRICVMMYYLEKISVREIAETLGCSENTVRSRLKYGKKNIRKKAEILKKQGYEFFGFAPVSFLLYLLQMDAAESGVVLSLAGGAGMTGIFGGMAVFRQFLFHSILGKGIMHIVGGMLAAGLLVGGYHLSRKVPEPVTKQSTGEKQTAKTDRKREKDTAATSGSGVPESTVQANHTEKPRSEEKKRKTSVYEGTPVHISDKEYPELLAGNLEKEDLEILLANAPSEMKNSELSGEETSELLLGSLFNADPPPVIKNTLKVNGSVVIGCLMEKSAVNRFLSAITDFQFTEKENSVPDIIVLGSKLYTEVCLEVATNTEGKQIIWKKTKLLDFREEDGRILVYYRREGYEEDDIIEEEIVDEEESGSVDEEEIMDDEESDSLIMGDADEEDPASEEEEDTEEDISGFEEEAEEEEMEDDDRIQYTQELRADLEKQDSGRYRIVNIHTIRKLKKKKK